MFNWKKDKKGNGNESYANETKNTFSHNDMISNDWDFDTDPNQQEDIDPIYLYDAIKPKNTSYYSEGINRDGDYLSELAKGDEFKQRTLTDADYNSISGVHREAFLRSASDIPRDNSGRPGANIQPGFGNQALNSYYEHEYEGSSEPERKTTPIFTRVNREETITSSFDSDNYGNGYFNSDNYDTKNYNSDSEPSKTYGGSSFGGNTYGGNTYGGSSFDTGNFGTDDFDIDDNSVGSGNFGSGNFGGGNFDSGNFGGGNFDSGNFGGGNFDSGNFGGGNFDSGNFGGDNFDSGNFGSASFGAGGFGSANFDASSAAANRAMNEKKEEEKPKNSGVGFDSLMSDNFGGNFDDGDFTNASYGVGGFGSANFTPGSASSTPSFGTSSSNPFQNDKRGGFDDLNNEFGGGNFDSGNIGVSGFGSASFGSGSFSGTNTGAAYANDGASGTGTMTYNSSSSSEEVSMNAGGYDGYGTDFYGNGYGSAPEESSVSSADIANAFAEFGDGPVNSFSSIKKEESNFGDFDYEYVPPVSPADEEPPEAVPHVKVDKPTYVYQRRTLGASSEAAEETKEAVAEEPAVATEEVAEAVNEEVVDEPATATVETKTEPVVVEHKFETAEEIRARASIRREEVKTEETEPEETKTEENKSEEIKSEEIKSEEIESESVEVKAEEPKEEETKKEEPKKSSASFYSPNSIFSLGPDEDDKFAHLRRHSDHVSMQARDIIAEINHFGETDEERQAAKEAKAKEEAEANAKTEVAEEVAEEVVEEVAEVAEEVTEEVVEEAAEVAEEVTEEVVEEAVEVAEEVTEEVVEEAVEVAEEVTEEVVEEAVEAAEEVIEEATEEAVEVTEEVTEEAAEEVTDDLTEIMESVKDLDDMTVIEMLNEAVSNSESSDDDFDDEYGDEPVVNDSSRDYGDVDKVLEEALGGDCFAQQSVSEIVEETTEVVEEVTEEVVEEVAEEVIEEATEEVTEEVIEEATEEVAEEIAEEVIEEATEEVAEEVAEEVIEEATEEVAEEVIEEAIEEVTEEVAEEVAEEVIEEATEEVTEEVVEEVAEEEPVYGAFDEPVYGAITEPVIEEVIEEVAEEVTEETAEETAEDPAEEIVEETVEEPIAEEPAVEEIATEDIVTEEPVTKESEEVIEESEEVAEEAEELDEEDYEDEVIDIDSEEDVEEDSEESEEESEDKSEEESEEKSEETKKTENAFDPAQWFNSMMEMMGFGMGTGAKAPETKASAETEDDKSEEDEAEKSDETKSYSGSYTDGFEEVCSICRRTESKAGKMMHMPPNLCVCADCMQRTMDSFSSFGLGGNSSLEEELSKLTGGNGMPGFGFINLANMQGEGAVPNKQKIKKKSKETKAAPIIDIKRIPAPHKIRETLDEYIVGQDHAKKIMSVAVYNHYKRVACDVNDEIEIEKSNMLMIGPTGSGKTYLVKTLARILDVPLAIADATSLTEAGYIGDDIESVVSKLLAAADNDVERAEKGIIYIDEIDKIAKKANTNSRDVSGESVQQGMLKLLEGAQIEVPVGATSKGAMVPLTTIDTRNILFICGGAFPDLQDIIKERLSKSSSIGFGATLKDEYNNDKDILHKVKIEDIRKFGMIPEFIGRLPIIYSLDAVTRDMLIRILKEPKNAILKQYQKLLALDDVNLVFADDAIEAIADKALAQDTGARALRSCIEDFMLDIMYEIPKDDNIGTVTITADYINGVGGPIIGIRGNEEPEIVTKTEGDDNE